MKDECVLILPACKHSVTKRTLLQSAHSEIPVYPGTFIMEMMCLYRGYYLEIKNIWCNVCCALLIFGVRCSALCVFVFSFLAPEETPFKLSPLPQCKSPKTCKRWRCREFKREFENLYDVHQAETVNDSQPAVTVNRPPANQTCLCTLFWLKSCLGTDRHNVLS